MSNFNSTTQAAFHARMTRGARALEENATWAVYSVKKNGQLYAKPGSLHMTEEAANAEVARMSALNPGHSFRAVVR
jgi:hypothetical protein